MIPLARKSYSAVHTSGPTVGQQALMLDIENVESLISYSWKGR